MTAFKFEMEIEVEAKTRDKAEEFLDKMLADQFDLGVGRQISHGYDKTVKRIIDWDFKVEE